MTAHATPHQGRHAAPEQTVRVPGALSPRGRQLAFQLMGENPGKGLDRAHLLKQLAGSKPKSRKRKQR